MYAKKMFIQLGMISEEDEKIETIEYDRDCTVEWDFEELYDKINELIKVINEMREDK